MIGHRIGAAIAAPLNFDLTPIVAPSRLLFATLHDLIFRFQLNR